MATRLVRPLYARLDRGTGDADTPVLRAVSNEPAQAAPPQSAKSFDDRSIHVLRGDNTGHDERRDASFAWPTTTLDDRSTKVQRDDEWRAEERAEATVPPMEKSSNEPVANSLPADKIVLEELEQEHELRSAAKAHSRRRYLDDDDISTGTIVRIAAAVIVLGLAFTILLPSILTRDPVEPTAAPVTSPAPARAVQPERTEAAQAAPAPPTAQMPQAAPPPPVPNASTSVAKTAPALRGSSPSEAKTERRATEQVLVPSTGKAATRTALTAAEQAAVTRGLQELEKRPAVSAARRPALTAEEQAAVERGLRELEKAGQAKP